MISDIGALFEMNSLNFSETSNTIDNNMMIPNIKKNVERNFLMIYRSMIFNISFNDE